MEAGSARKRRAAACGCVHDLDGVGAGLALHGQDDGPRVPAPAGDLVVLHAVDDLSQVVQAHWRPVAPCHDQGPEGGGVHELAAGLHVHGRELAVQVPVGRLTCGTVDGVGHLFEAHVTACQGLGVELHPHRVLLGAIDRDLGHAADHGDARGDDVVGVLVDHGHGLRGRGHGQVEDGRVGRVDLLVGRGAGHVRRQLALDLGDGRLHVLGRGVDGSLQGELQGHARSAQCVGGTDGVDTRDGRELALQGGGHGGGHGLGAGAGQVGRD